MRTANTRNPLIRTSVTALALILIATVPADAGVFAKLGDIKGEVPQGPHKGWSECSSFSQGQRAEQGSGGKRFIKFDGFRISKSMDAASPRIAEAVPNGKVFPSVEINLTRMIGGQERVYLTYQLKNVMVSSYEVSVADALTVPVESFSLNFEEIKVIYRPMTEGGAGTPVEYSWKVEEGEA